MMPIKSITAILVSALTMVSVTMLARVDAVTGAPAQSTIATDTDVNLLVALTRPGRTVVDLGGAARTTGPSTVEASAEIVETAGNNGVYLEGLKNILAGLIKGAFDFGHDSEAPTGAGREGT